jgi:membrane fusion protein (multidrug efflux system)
MLQKFSITTIIIVLVAGGLVGTKIMQFKAMGAAGAAQVIPAETVTATSTKEENWENNITATGSVVAVQGVTVSAEMAGKITKIAFESGATVAAGDLLVQLDTSTEEAQLRAAEAGSALATLNLNRAKELREKNTKTTSARSSPRKRSGRPSPAGSVFASSISGRSSRKAIPSPPCKRSIRST